MFFQDFVSESGAVETKQTKRTYKNNLVFCIKVDALQKKQKISFLAAKPY